MKKWGYIIGLFIVFIGSELFVVYNLSKIQNIKSRLISSSTGITPTPQLVSSAKNPAMTKEAIAIYCLDIFPSLYRAEYLPTQNTYFVNERTGYIGTMERNIKQGGMRFELIDGDKKRIGGYSFTQEELSKVIMKKQVDTNTTPITQSELKKGDKIIIRWSEDIHDKKRSLTEFIVLE